MEELMRALMCPCRVENVVTCRCHDLAPQHRCACVECISQRVARLEGLSGRANNT